MGSASLLGGVRQSLFGSGKNRSQHFEEYINGQLVKLFDAADPIRERNYEDSTMFIHLSVTFEVLELINNLRTLVIPQTSKQLIDRFQAKVYQSLQEIVSRFTPDAFLAHSTALGNLINLLESGYICL